jgi:hypothetical protein
MIGFATIAAAALLFIVAALALNGRLEARNASPDTKTSRTLPSPFPAEMLQHVFSSSDWHFVRSVESLYVRKLFLRERKAVALKWVAETAAALNIVMREHALAARQSTNLNPVTELTLFARYLSLLLLCGLMSIAIRIAGPIPLGGVAQLTQEAFEHMAQSQRLLPSAAQTPEALAGVRN